MQPENESLFAFSWVRLTFVVIISEVEEQHQVVEIYIHGLHGE